MNWIVKSLLISTLGAALSGCFEVEDNNNGEASAAAIAEQNTLIQQQNEEILAQKTPITLFGQILNGTTQELVSSANVSIKVGAEWRATETFSGEFVIKELPVATDIVVLVQSPSGEFLDRAFFGKTLSVESGQVASQSMGNLLVSEGVVKSYSVLDTESSESFEGVEFSYNSSSVFSSYADTSLFNTYQVKSTYDAETQLYSITLPKDFSFQLVASGDVDGDGVVDFTTNNSDYWSSDKIQLNSAIALQLETIYVDPTPAYQPVELRISVIDSYGDVFEDIEFYVNDNFLGRINLEFDAESKEYVFNYSASGQIEILMPSFAVEDDNSLNYSSATMTLRRTLGDTLYLYGSGFQNSLPSSIAVIDSTVSIVVQPRAISVNDYISRASSIIDENDNYSWKQFYSAPIGVIEESISLTQRNILEVVKGNESDADLVPAGSTMVNVTSKEMSVNNSLTYNDTFLTVASVQNLSAGDYRYSISQLTNRATGNVVDVSYSENFSIARDISTDVFAISDIKLDNNNATTNEVVIVANNTAGIASGASNNRTGAALYFPNSIETLDFLELTLVETIINGFSRTYQNRIRVIDGTNFFPVKRNLVSLAENELIYSSSGYSTNVVSKTALPDGTWYMSSSLSMYSQDNSNASVNTATFNYIYRVSGETQVYEGTITLPVL